MFTKDKSFYKSLVLLAIPMILQNLVTFSVGLADNIMIGTLGDSAVSGVYMGNQIQTVLQVLCTGIDSTILLLSAQYWGKHDTASIRKIIAVGTRFSVIIGLVFSIVCAIMPSFVVGLFTKEPTVIENGADYLSIVCFSFLFFTITQALIASMRSVENARIGLVVSLSSLVTDVILNYILIFGKLGFPALGVKGAAIATLIARILETAIIVFYVRFIDKKLDLRLTHLLRLDKTILRDFVRYGAPLVAGQLVWGTNLMANSAILGHITGTTGAITEGVITATSLANTVNSLMYVSMNGLSGAVGIVIGKTIGAGKSEKIREYARTAQLLFVALGLLTSLLFQGIREPFLSLYDISDTALAFSRQFINVLCFTCIGTCYQCGSLTGLVKAGGDVKFVFRNDSFFVFCVVIPSALITSALGLEPWIVFLCLKCDQVLKCIPAFFKIRRYNWIKNLTRSVPADEEP